MAPPKGANGRKSKFDSDSDDSSNEKSARPTNARKASAPKLYQIAKITQLATDGLEDAENGDDGGESSASGAAKLASVDSGILSRIQKSLALAKHPGTGEAEARQALRLATRLMASQNLTQADLIASEDSETAQTRAGMSQVEIVSTTGSMVRNESWANRIAIAINLFFSVKAYSTSHTGRQKLTWTFYGLALNTVAAATAFEMVHNQVLTWAADNRMAKGKTGKNSYCQGVAAGLVDMAKKEKKEELQLAIQAEKKRVRQAIKQEKADRQRELDRLQGPSTERRAKVEEADEIDEADVKPLKRSPSSDAHLSTEPATHSRRPGNNSGAWVKPERDPLSPRVKDEHGLEELHGYDNDDYSDDGGADMGGGSGFSGLSSEFEVKPDFDEELERDIIDLTKDTDDEDAADDRRDVKVKAEGIAVKQEEAEQAQWRDSGQLIQFRQNADKIADNYLQNLHGGKLKLRKRQAASYIKDAQAYEQGRQDAKKIDVKRRRIQGGVDAE